MEKQKILVVDDDDAILNSLESALSAAGFETSTAKNGSEGLAKALNEKPQLIVSDVEMPILGGMEMLKELRKTGDWGKAVPVIMLTNYDTNEKIMQGIVEDEPSFYILKSTVKPGAVVEIIKEKLKVVTS